MTRPETPLSSNLQTELGDVVVYLSDHGTPDMGYDQVVQRGIKEIASLVTRLTQAAAEIERLTRLNEGLVHDFNTLLVDGSNKDSDNKRLRAVLAGEIGLVQLIAAREQLSDEKSILGNHRHVEALAALSCDSSAPIAPRLGDEPWPEDSASETPTHPTPHHVRYDRLGWVCSMCGGWNDAAGGVTCRWPHKSAPETPVTLSPDGMQLGRWKPLDIHQDIPDETLDRSKPDLSQNGKGD